jgi:ferrous iron transport protein B
MMNIALLGNPNSGKTSLFNALTGLNQKVGNFPGVTVEKKTGTIHLEINQSVNIIDLPGTYSLYPRREDEWVTYRVLMSQDPELIPDVIILVADASNMKRNLLFCSQVLDLKIPVVVALTMVDLARKKGISIDLPGLERELGVPVVAINPRKNKGVSSLLKTVELTIQQQYKVPNRDFINNAQLAPTAIQSIKEKFPETSDYKAIHYLIHHESFPFTSDQQKEIEAIEKNNKFNPTKVQAEEILQRYNRIKMIMNQTVSEPDPLQKSLFTEKLDNILLHRRWGYVILLAVLFTLFQSVFWIASYPMDWIESFFGWATEGLQNTLPEGWFSDLVINGLVAGLGGIVIFVPQIMILFGLITILEDTGYMARISFLTDRLMRQVGINGKSVMPMISGFACAVPAIMSARSIENKKERLLTILVTPLMSCSARLPIYTIMIGLVVPAKTIGGIFSLQGLVMMSLYLFGLVMALIVSWVLKWFINIKEKSFFILELPTYRSPRWGNIATTMVEKAKIFVLDAGKIILFISIVLWALSSYGPSDKMQAVAQKYERLKQEQGADLEELNKAEAGEKLSESYAGILGKTIEPVIRPLGYDWKIGIALITSFAAREVFVGTMATLYSVGDADESSPLLRNKMKEAKFENGEKVYSLATAFSLLIFYALAMQCMSTLAIVKRETNSWKWPTFQFAYMTVLAYVLSFVAYQILK